MAYKRVLLINLAILCSVCCAAHGYDATSSNKGICKKTFEMDIEEIKEEVVKGRNKMEKLEDGVERLQNSSDNLLREMQNELAASRAELVELKKEVKNIKKELKEFTDNLNQNKEAIDCFDLMKQGKTKSGIYKIIGNKEVYCDMETDFGGWTLITKRIDGKVHFNRNWQEYKSGFGNIGGEHWIGNNRLRKMSISRCNLVVRIEIWNADNIYSYGEWKDFYISSEADKYKINFGNYNGNLTYGPDDLNYHKGMKFTTEDQDNDPYPSNCASFPNIRGGWWFNSCYRLCLTSPYVSSKGNMFAGVWTTTNTYLKRAEMKIRPMKSCN